MAPKNKSKKPEFNPERLAEILYLCNKDATKKGFKVSKKDIMSVGGIKRMSSDFIEDTAYILKEEYNIILTNLKEYFVLQTIKHIKKVKKLLKTTLKQYI